MNTSGLAHQTSAMRSIQPHTPAHWRWRRIKGISTINRLALPEDTDSEFEFYYIDVGAVTSDGAIGSPERLCFEDAPSRARRLVAQGDTIVSTVRTYLRAIAWIAGDASDVVVSTGFATVTPHATVDPRFLFWWLCSTPSVEEIVARSVGVSYPAVNASEVGDIGIAIPPLDEQRHIAAYLDAETARVDRLVGENNDQQRLQRELLLTTMVDRLLPSDPNHDWRHTRLKYLFEPEWPGTWGAEPNGGRDDILCVRVADFDRLNFVAGRGAETYRSVPSAERARRVLCTGDVLLEKSGGTKDKPVGCAVSFDGDEPAVCSNFIAVLRPLVGLNPRYGALLMAALYQSKRNSPFVKQTTGIQNLDSHEYLGLRIAVPDRATQDGLVTRLERERDLVNRRLSELRRQSDLLGEHRQALITAAVTGQLDLTRSAA